MAERLNVIVIAVDSLRADHLGCYGYGHSTSPNIDRIASEGALFRNFYCAGIPTQPSFTTLYTGQHPIRHGIVSHGGEAELANDTPLLPQVFLRHSYATCAVDNLMRERLWFGRGYEYYVDPSLRRILSLGVTCEELNARAVPWIKNHADEPFFFFIHYWDPHTPYNPPDRLRGMFYNNADPFDPANSSLKDFWPHPFGRLARDTWLRTRNGLVTDADFVTAMYDQEIRHVDEGIGELVNAVDELGLAGNTVIVILGDHGESMTEHGIFYEHHGLYDATIRIPFIVRCPGIVPAGAVRDNLLQHQDVAPTLLQAAGLPKPRSMDGIGFWNAVVAADPQLEREHVVSAECTLQAKWSLRTRDRKLILAREPDFYGTPMRELYDLNQDPGETRNLAEEQPLVADEMERTLEGWIREQLHASGRTQDPLVEQRISLRAVLDQAAGA